MLSITSILIERLVNYCTFYVKDDFIILCNNHTRLTKVCAWLAALYFYMMACRLSFPNNMGNPQTVKLKYTAATLQSSFLFRSSPCSPKEVHIDFAQFYR